MDLAIGAFVILLFLFIVFTLVAVWATRVRKVGPNEVLVISGRRRPSGHHEIETVSHRQGGRAFITHSGAGGHPVARIAAIEVATDDHHAQRRAVTLEHRADQDRQR